MNVVTGNVRRLEGNGALTSAAWTRDGSRVLWVSFVAADQACEAYLLDVAESESLKLTNHFRDMFRSGSPELAPLWTPDGRFVVGSNIELGGYLIQPKPWSVRRIGQKLQRPGEAVPTWVRRQAVPDVLIASWGSEEAAVDYGGKILKELGSGGFSGWTVLPEARQAVSVQPGNKIVITPVE